MGVIVDLQPGDGILVEIIDWDDGKDGRELLVLEVVGVEGSKFSARLLNRSRVGQTYEYWDDRYVFTGEVKEDEPLVISLTCYNWEGEKFRYPVSCMYAFYLGAPVDHTSVTMMTRDGKGREIVCRIGDHVLTSDGPRTVKAVYENVVVVKDHNYVYLGRYLQKKLGSDHWPDSRHRQTWNFGGAVAYIVPITSELAESLNNLKYSKEYAELQEDHSEFFEWANSARSYWFGWCFPPLANEPYPSELLNATAPQMVLALVDSGYFFSRSTDVSPPEGISPSDPFKVYPSWYQELYDRSWLMRTVTRAVVDRLESLAELLGRETKETTPFEVLLWKEASYLKGTYEYLSTGIPGETCGEVYCDSECEYCGGGDPNYRGESLWY
ncbi:hypothetical protein [uncultured Rothia sp.]|uniref:hypothetical protein n=1 Tax=uncultured Rothia sp. TaxID=316088 RepID=UPI0025ED4568|nr:hypothetical protein [uncultured Rothia sp.]